MEVITIDSSNDESDCTEANDKERSDRAHRGLPSIGIRALSLSSASTSNKFQSNGDNDSSSTDSSDDSIWNVKGLLSSLNVAVQKVDSSSCSSSDYGVRIKSRDCFGESDSRPLSIIISPSNEEKRSHSIAQSEDDGDGSISSDDSIWNETGLVLRSKAMADGGESRTPPRSPRRNGCAYDTNNNAKNLSCVALKRVTVGSTPEHQLHVNGIWKIVLLMDHREFGCANNFLQTVQKKINSQFGGPYSEITTLPSADYMFVARFISNTTGEVLDERLLDLVIERKNVQDVCKCLISDSKKYKPLSFFEAQMYKLQHCGISNKLFLMEGDEDRTRNFFVGAKSEIEKAKRLKRVKTIRKQIENGEFPGVDIVCTRNRAGTIQYLIYQLERFIESFDPVRLPTKTMEQLKLHINEKMKNPTFLEYLRLRKQPRIGDVKAMKIIMDPSLDWDKSFVSPSSKKQTKATLTDRATFWKSKKYRADIDCPDHVNIKTIPSSRGVEKSSRSIPLALQSEGTEKRTGTVESVCGVCCQSIDIWTDVGIVSCNRVAACGATFHLICLASKNYDIHACDGCIKCNASTKRELGASNEHAAIIMFDVEDDDETDVVVVLD